MEKLNEIDQKNFADSSKKSDNAINDLPDEMLHKIFDKLAVKTIVKARFVCRRWNEALHYTIGKKFLNGSADILNWLESIIHIFQLYCRVCVHVCKDCGSRCSEHKKFPARCEEAKFNSVLEVLLRLYGDGVKTIGISHPGFPNLKANNSLTQIAKYCQIIEFIKIKSSFIPSSIKELMKGLAFSCPKIKEISFTNICNPKNQFSLNEFTYLFEELPLQVFRLKLFETKIDSPLIPFPKSLEEFSLTKLYKGDNSSALVRNLAKSCPKLQRLNMNSEFSHDLLDVVAHSCPNITKLQFSFSEEKLNMTKFQNLKSVGLYVNKEKFWLESLPQSIEEISVESTEYLYHQKNYHDYYLNTLMKFPQLRSLKISFFIPEEKLRELAKKCPNLEYLKFCCGTLFPEEIAHLKKLFGYIKYFEPFRRYVHSMNIFS